MNKFKILFICGSHNQTTMMHQISQHLIEYDCYFTPYYADGYIDMLASNGYLDFTVLGGSFKETTMNYLWNNKLNVDYYGNSYNYDLVVTCSDLLVPKNVKNKKMILVQEGMTDPKNIMFYLVKWLKIPRYLASTSTNGMSDSYNFFCVASEGYKELFQENGINPSKMLVTGIPNFDNCETYRNNEFPYKDYLLVATSDARETYKFENRKKFIFECMDIAAGRKVIFKLHPNENFDRATYEINKWGPGAMVNTSGNVHEMIANSSELITKYSTVVYTGIALGKKVQSYFDYDELVKLTPIQNGGTSAKNISNVCLQLLHDENQVEVNRSISKKAINTKWLRSKAFSNS